MVDEAKAFCPGCGNAFVEEQTRREASNFDTMERTINLGQTMYNQMLSDMGLDTSKAPQKAETRIEVIAPVAATAKPSPVAARPKPSGSKKWLIIAAIAVAVLFLILIALGVAGYIYYRSFSGS